MRRAAFISKVTTGDQAEQFEGLVREYVAWLPFSLEFQGIDGELEQLRSEYGPPGGAAFLAYDGDGDEAIGCVALRRLSEGVAELKRMYVRPAARGKGSGSALCESAIACARDLGYSCIRLDTVAELTAAAEIYMRAGFVEIPPYRDNPLESARYYELRLSPPPADHGPLDHDPAS